MTDEVTRAACNAISGYPTDTDHPMAILARYAIRDIDRVSAHATAQRHAAYHRDGFDRALDRIDAARTAAADGQDRP